MLSIPSGQQDVELGISTTQITISDNDGKFLLRDCVGYTSAVLYVIPYNMQL